MENEEILKKAIEKAVENGWKHDCNRIDEVKECDNYRFELFKRTDRTGGVGWVYSLFDPEWAKAFWGDEQKVISDGEGGETTTAEWCLYHHELLEIIQVGRDPIKYLERFL